MKYRSPENVSRLVDNEMEPWELAETLHEVGRTPELEERWRNYHLIGDAMRSQLCAAVGLDLGQRVARALESEPLHFPARPLEAGAPAAESRTRAAVGVALAASLSAVAILGVLEMGRSGVPGTDVVADAIEHQAPEAVYTFTANITRLPEGALGRSELAGAQTVSAERSLPLARDLTDYLMNYPRHVASHEDEDTLSYLRLVGNTE